MTTIKAFNRSPQSGVSMIETMLVMPIMLIIGFGIVQGGLVYQAQANLEYAALMAARVGASTSINVNQMAREVAYRMQATSGIDGSDDDAVLGQLGNISVEVLNPTLEMFQACGEQPSFDTTDCYNPGRCEIPYFGQQFYDNQILACNGASIQDANILRVRVTYRYNSGIPFVSNIRLVGESNFPDGDNGTDITAVATVRMQSPARLTLANYDSIYSAP